MSNKKIESLNIIDRELRKCYPVGMSDATETKVIIELINGFELFNTRPYHNHETWSDGYRITDTKTGLKYEAEDLDDAIFGFIEKMKKQKEQNEQQNKK
jgi:hypothetical protein